MLNATIELIRILWAWLSEPPDALKAWQQVQTGKYPTDDKPGTTPQENVTAPRKRAVVSHNP